MRWLFINDENKQKVLRLVAYASLPEHYFHMDAPEPRPTPGDNPNHVVYVDTFQCVFTITVHYGIRFRHLSVSVPHPGFYPPRVATCTIATWFGFTGAETHDGVAVELGPNWSVGRCEACPCNAIILLQPLEPN